MAISSKMVHASSRLPRYARNDRLGYYLIYAHLFIRGGNL